MGKIRKNIDEEKKALILQQDLKVVRALSGNNGKLRERVLRNLQKWFADRSSRMPFAEEDFVRIWKGLFYTMWMSDKPLVQEECAEKISKLVRFSHPETALLFFRSGLKVLTTEWFGIDQLRLDKFLMFVRRFLRQILEVLKETDWELELIQQFGDILLETVLQKNNTTHLSLTMHVTEIYLEELAKVSKGKLEKHVVTAFLTPFVKQLSVLEDNRQALHLRKYLFYHLLEQTNEAVEYEDRFDAWRRQGFPEGTIESIQKVEVSDDESSQEEGGEEDAEDDGEKPLDPRAGHVDVELPQLQFDPLEISRLLSEHKFAPGSSAQTRKIISKLIEDFERLSRGDYPLGIKKLPVVEFDGHSTALKKSMNRLVKFEKQLLSDSTKNNKIKMRKKKQRKNKELKREDLLPIMSDMLQRKLHNFVKRSEANLEYGTEKVKSKRKLEVTDSINGSVKKTKMNDSLPEYENHFQRNSGTWFVHRYDNGDTSLAENLDDDLGTNATENGNVVNSPKLNKEQNGHIFPQNEWDLPLKEGETEIFMPSKKFNQKTLKGIFLDDMYKKLMGKNNSRDSPSSSDFHKKKRFSLDANLIKDPFTRPGSTPRSEKRVKINLKLNKSQEVHEHHARIKSSPAIPFNANQKPVKPLLKPNAVSSPINPFYRKKLQL